MKKMMVSAFVLVAVGAMFVACDGIANGCKCTYTYEGISASRDFTKAEVESTGSKSCSAFANWCDKNVSEGEGSWSCKSK